MIPPDPCYEVRFIEVASEYDGQRIDNFLFRILKGIPKSKIYSIVRKGEVRVNRGRVRPDYRLRSCDQIRIPPLRLTPEGVTGAPPRVLVERLANAVLLENREVLVLAKPAGLAVHKGSGVDFGIIEILRDLRPELPFLELAHRLDRDTSGCLVLAKTPETLRRIQAAQRTGRLDKRYLALVRGRWDLGAVTVEAPLRKQILRGGERMVEVMNGGKPAFSRFEPITLFRRASLLEVKIATGRTHQIRVHASFAGHPIAGDDKYGDVYFNREMACFGLKRLFLHAHSITLPLGEGSLSVEARLTEKLELVLERLQADL